MFARQTMLALALALLTLAPASAALKVDASAPAFTAQAALGGDVKEFDLEAALAKGPVVLYFFPKSFTSGCTMEAHAFSDHIAEFRKYGATVVGVSGDDIETQKRFSTQECHANFLVASDPGLKIARSYDAVVMGMFANRTSYVIGRDGKVIETYTDMEPLGHIDKALATLRGVAKRTHEVGAVERVNEAEAQALWRLVDVPFDQLDALPFGAIVVDPAGTIVAYNQYEARLTRQDREAVIGKNFFYDVAPCTAVQAFQGRLQAFTRAKSRVSERFNYFFPLLTGAVEVTITFLKLRGKNQILIAVERVDTSAIS